MPSIVDICNTALSHIGAEAQVASISPPDGSVEAGYCARFYPIARRTALEANSPRFAQKRSTLAEVANTSNVWAYAYELPSDCVRPLRVFNGSTLDALLAGADSTVSYLLTDERGSADFTVEGTTLRTNEPEAVLLYVFDQTDTTKWTPTFGVGVGMLLAGYLAGPIIKGNDGMRVGQAWTNAGMNTLTTADISEANASSERNDYLPDTIRARA